MRNKDYYTPGEASEMAEAYAKVSELNKKSIILHAKECQTTERAINLATEEIPKALLKYNEVVPENVQETLIFNKKNLERFCKEFLERFENER